MRKFLVALTFLTRLPAPIPANVTPEEMGKSSAFFPLVGLILGGILVGLNWLIGHIWESAFVINAILLVSLIGLTGGLHLDGLMDTCDGIFSGRPKERMLEIMKDSSVGAFGILGAISVLLLKLAFLNEVDDTQKWQALVLTPVFGRWSMSFALVAFPYARQEGMGSTFADFASVKSLIWASVLLVIAFVVILRWRVGFIMSPLVLLTYVLAWRISAKLDGLTGDTYGAICEFMEMISFAAFSV
ncbi:TPA: adenosylcobinamide-GDP ribazoletransferase [Candidatus Poribacteria bacterium]|nr:adenosylcobinamide-GDP ribazoletransferase [Candidatus Poribacteria bacterium]